MTVLRVNPDYPTSFYSLPQLLVGTTVFAGAGAAAAILSELTLPWGGALFGVSSFLSSCTIDLITYASDCYPRDLILRITRSVFSVLLGIAIGAGITTAAGFPLAFAPAMKLTALSLAIESATVFIILDGWLCSAAIVAGTTAACATFSRGRV